MAGAGWKILKQTDLLDRSPYIKVIQQTILLEDGITQVPDFYRVETRPFVGVVAITPDDDVVVLRHYRLAAEGYIREIVTGARESRENPLESAQRELYEETGYEAADWTQIGRVIMDPNQYMNESYYFLARNARQVVQPNDNDLEEHTVELHPISSVRRMFGEGEFVTMASVVALGLAFNALNQEK